MKTPYYLGDIIIGYGLYKKIIELWWDGFLYFREAVQLCAHEGDLLAW